MATSYNNYLVNTWVQKLRSSVRRKFTRIYMVIYPIVYNMNNIYRDDILSEITEMQRCHYFREKQKMNTHIN